MSENEREETIAADAAVDNGQNPAAAEGVESSAKLSELMASGVEAAQKAGRPDLDAEALAAAQAAIAEGERALAEARAQLTKDAPAKQRGSRRRELALRLLLAANVLAMVIVAVLPGTTSRPDQQATATDHPAATTTPETQREGPRLATKYNQALLASERGDFARALELMKEYVADSPRMPESRRVSVYLQMAFYASNIGLFNEAAQYESKAQMVRKSHSLPEDLVAMAEAAMQNGDHEALRQVWARFLLQQRQIPSSLYQHVAEAYLQLGDSYRLQANEAADRARLEELQKTADLLREQASAQESGQEKGQERNK